MSGHTVPKDFISPFCYDIALIVGNCQFHSIEAIARKMAIIGAASANVDGVLLPIKPSRLHCFVVVVIALAVNIVVIAPKVTVIAPATNTSRTTATTSLRYFFTLVPVPDISYPI